MSGSTIAAGGTLTNLGTITAPGAGGVGVTMLGGGSLTNGAGADTAATISAGLAGVEASKSGTVMNFGSIIGSGTAGTGIWITGGTVTVDNLGLISGARGGIHFNVGTGSLGNAGTINSTNGAAFYAGTSGVALTNLSAITSGTGNGVNLAAGGSVTNGSSADAIATIYGGNTAVFSAGSGTATNFGTISGAGVGIWMLGGTVTVDNYGLVMSKSAAIRLGVLAATVTNWGTVTSAGPVGVYSVNPGITVTNLGTINAAGTVADGLKLNAGGSVTNGSSTDTTATMSGGNAAVFSAGSSTVTNFGTIRGSGDGMGIWMLGGTVTVENFGLVTSKSAAVRLGAVAATVMNSGIINSAGPVGVYDVNPNIMVTNLGTINAPGTVADALKLDAGGSVTNGSSSDTTAIMSGGNAAVFSAGSGTATNFGTVSSAGVGIWMTGGTVAVDNFGFITANSAAIRFTVGAATVTNSGTIISTGAVGVYGTNPGVTVTNLSTIIAAGTVGSAVTLATAVKLNGGAIINGTSHDTTATLIGNNAGAFAAGNSTVINFGTIVGGVSQTMYTPGFDGVFCATGVTNTGSVDNLGLIYGTGCGVQFGRGTGTLINTGTIFSTGTQGVPAAGVYLSAGDVTVINAGTIGAEAAGEPGVFAGFGTATIDNTGTIISGAVTVRFCGDASGTLNNEGVIRSTGVAGAVKAVYVDNTGISVTNLNLITAPANVGQGVKLFGQDMLTNGASNDTTATIVGGYSGVFFSGSGTLTNFGTIVGGACGGAWLVGGPVTVTNSGLISSTGVGVQFSGGGGSLTNSGTIASNGRFGVYASDPDVIMTNLGTITTSNSPFDGVKLLSQDVLTNGARNETTATISAGSGSYAGVMLGGSATVTNFGTITGPIGVVATEDAGNCGTVVDAGRIASSNGATGIAIRFGAGTARLVVDPGATLVGKVQGSSGGVLELAAGGGAASIGAVTGIGTLTVDSAANWTLQSTNNVINISNNSTLAVGAGATLQVTGSIVPGSTGLFVLNAGALLDVGADVGSADQMQFIGSAELEVQNAAHFGIGVGTSGYAGPLIGGFGAGDTIDLANIAAAGTTLDYTAATGLLQIASGASTASLLFSMSSLGSGSFHIGRDAAGHLLITHS